MRKAFSKTNRDFGEALELLQVGDPPLRWTVGKDWTRDKVNHLLKTCRGEFWTKVFKDEIWVVKVEG